MAVIGAGIAGITAGVLLPIKVPGIQLTIFDKNSDVVRKTPAYTFFDPLTHYHREAHGSRISTPASDAISHHIATSQPTRPKSTGPRSMPKAMRSRTTGNRSLGSSMSTRSAGSRPKSTLHNGFRKRQNGV